jgi:phage FluMu gp28-like protein
MPDAIDLGLVEVINRTRGTKFTREQFLADCRSRARLEEVFQQAYMCNPSGAASNHIVDWSAIERCRMDYAIERVHLEADQILQKFQQFSPAREYDREREIKDFIKQSFPKALKSKDDHRLGFDVAASGQGDLAAFYIDEVHGAECQLRALLTCRTEDWHFLKTVLFFFLRKLRSVQAAGDESGLGRQICWEAAQEYSDRFLSVNFASKKSDLGFALMNQLSVAGKRFPKSEQDIASDYFALRKSFTGSKWVFSEGTNTLNPASHCDIAWAGALSTHAHTERRCTAGAAVLFEDGTIFDSEYGYRELSR